jgi:hypothetical protein
LLVVVSLLFLVRKFHPHPLKEHQQQVLIGPLSFFFAIYAFFLSFSMITLWVRYDDVNNSINKEANSLIVTYHLSYTIKDSGRFRNTLKAYLRSVIDEEWNAMEKGQVSPATEELDENIWASARKLKPVTIPEQEVYKEILDALKDFNEHREERMLSVSGSLLQPMWIVLTIGGLCSIVGLYYLSLSHHPIQTVIDIILISIIVANLFLIYELNGPFEGCIKIPSKAFSVMYQKIERLEKQTHGE